MLPILALNKFTKSSSIQFPTIFSIVHRNARLEDEPKRKNVEYQCEIFISGSKTSIALAWPSVKEMETLPKDHKRGAY